FRVSIMIGSPFFLYCADDVFLRNGSKMAAVTAFNPVIAEDIIMSFRNRDLLDVLNIKIRRLNIGLRKHASINENDVVTDGHHLAGESVHRLDVRRLFVFNPENDDISPVDRLFSLAY